MAAGKLIDDHTANIIWHIYDANKGLKAAAIMNKVHKKLGDQLSKNGTWPGLRAIQHEIMEYKERMRPTQEEDQPWSVLSSYRVYELEPAALPIVMDVWAYTLSNRLRPLTIRQAKWVCRLYKLFTFHPDIHEGPIVDLNPTIGQLWEYATKYAAYEESSIALGEKVAETVKFVGFKSDTELFVDILHQPSLTTDDIIKVRDDPFVLRRKRQAVLKELRNPDTLKRLELDKLDYWGELTIEDVSQHQEDSIGVTEQDIDDIELTQEEIEIGNQMGNTNNDLKKAKRQIAKKDGEAQNEVQ